MEGHRTKYLIKKRDDVPVAISMEEVTQMAATVTEAKAMIHRSLRQLIQNVQLNISEAEIAHRFKTANQVILLGDGGARHQNAGHGAVVAIDGDIVLENHGKPTFLSSRKLCLGRSAFVSLPPSQHS